MALSSNIVQKGQIMILDESDFIVLKNLDSQIRKEYEQYLYIIQILKTQKTFRLIIDEVISLLGLAKFFNEKKIIKSMNIGIYSQNKQYYTNNLDEQLQTIGTGSDDTYYLLDANLTDICFQLNSLLEKNGKQIESNSKKYTIHKTQIIDPQQLLLKELNKKQIELSIYFGYKQVTLNLQCDLSKTTIQDLKLAIELKLDIRNDIASVDIYINDIQIFENLKVLKKLFVKNPFNFKISARLQFIFRQDRDYYDDPSVTLIKIFEFYDFLEQVGKRFKQKSILQEIQDIDSTEINQKTKKYITFIIQSTGMIYNHQVCGCLRGQEIAEHFFQIKQLKSMNIAIYSAQEQNFTEDLQKEIITTYTNSGSIFVISEGDQSLKFSKLSQRKMWQWKQIRLNKLNITLIVQDFQHKKKYNTTILGNQRVRTLYELLQNQTILRNDKIILSYEGLLLDQNHTIESYGILDGSVIIVTLKMRILYGKMPDEVSGQVGREILQVMSEKQMVQQEQESSIISQQKESSIISQQNIQDIQKVEFQADINIFLIFESDQWYTRKEISVSPLITIDELVQEIQRKYKIQNFQLHKKQIFQDINLTQKKYKMQRLQNFGKNDSQLYIVQEKLTSELKIHILCGPKPIIIDYKCNLRLTTIQDLKLKVEKHLFLQPEIASVDIYINSNSFTQENEFKRKLFQLAVHDKSKIIAKIKYNGYYD